MKKSLIHRLLLCWNCSLNIVIYNHSSFLSAWIKNTKVQYLQHSVILPIIDIFFTTKNFTCLTSSMWLIVIKRLTLLFNYLTLYLFYTNFATSKTLQFGQLLMDVCCNRESENYLFVKIYLISRKSILFVWEEFTLFYCVVSS